MPKSTAKAKKSTAGRGAKRKSNIVKLRARKKPVKKAVKKAPAKLKVVTRKKVDLNNIRPLTDKMSKSSVIHHISEQTGLPRTDVTEVFRALAVCVHGQMHNRGFGELSIPETGVKVRRVRKPATKSRKMISPFTGQEIMVKAKPARNVVKLTALKSLKESVKK